MQEVTTLTQSATPSFEQMRSSALLDVSSQSRAFSDFMGLLSKAGTPAAASPAAASRQSEPALAAATATAVQGQTTQINAAPAATTNAAPVQPVVQTDTASTLATNVSAQTATAGSSSPRVAAATESSLNAARNTPVSREAFEQARPLLAKSGMSEDEINDLSKRVQAGSLTWGQMVQSLAKHTAGAKKSASLSDSEKGDLRAMMQKMGFGAEAAGQLVAALANGNGEAVLGAIGQKLAGMDADSTLDFDSDEMSAFCKALGLGDDAAKALTTKLASGQATVKDMQSALTSIGQELQNQRGRAAAQDTDVARGLGKLMEKDVAKNARDTSSTTTADTTGSGGQVKFDLKAKDRNDTSWFDQREKNQQESSDESWKNFLSKTRQADGQQQAASTATSPSQTAQQSSSQGATKQSILDAAGPRLAQAATGQSAKAETASQSAAYSKVAAPKVLDQVTEAMLKDLGQGRKQLTIQLDPENLGKVQVVLQVKGKEVSAALHAQDADTAAMLTGRMEEIKKSLEEKGLTVQTLEVHSGLASRQEQQAAFNTDQHNQAQQQQQDMSRIFSHLRMLKADAGTVALDMQNSGMQEILADQGLHLIA
jgi:flagellar hook-length control protein FliK